MSDFGARGHLQPADHQYLELRREPAVGPRAGAPELYEGRVPGTLVVALSPRARSGTGDAPRCRHLRARMS